MLGKKLTQILGALDRKTFKELGRVLGSPVFNTDENLVKMYQFLSPYFPHFGEQDMDREHLYAQLYPGKTYKDGTLRVKLRQFTKVVEDFLVWKSLQEDDQLRQRLLLRAYGQRDLYPLFSRETTKALQTLAREPQQDINFFQHQYALLYQLYFHPLTDKYQEKEDWLGQLTDAADHFFVLTKLRIALAAKNQDAILAQSHPIRFWEALKQEHEHGLLATHTLTQIYLALFALLDSKTDADFFAFKEQFRHHQHELPATDLPSLYYTTLNYLSRQINSGRSEFYPELLEWYQLGLTDGLLIRQNNISEVTFNNITLLGYQSGAFEWTDRFIDDYAPLLEERGREDAVICSRGLGDFFRGHFLSAIATLYNHKFARAYQLRVRLTIIRAMYEIFQQDQEEYDRIMGAIQSFEAFMKRDRTFSPRMLAPYQNHLAILKGMIQYHLQPQDKEAWHQWLDQEWIQRPSIIAKDWLMEKAAEL